MFLYRREKSLTLHIMESLASRTALNGKSADYLIHLRKGHEWEEKLDQQMEGCGDSILVFPGALLQPQMGNAFQWDTIVLAGTSFYLYEVKSFSGTYRYGKEMWVSETGFEISNPQIQMQDNKNRFKNLLRELGYAKDFQVKAYAVMVHPEFTLLGAPEQETLLLPTQLKRHFTSLAKGAPPLTRYHHLIVQKLLAQQGVERAFWDHIPPYCYEDLHKGLRCPDCGSFSLHHSRQVYDCTNCGIRGTHRALILFHWNELKQLFPNMSLKSKVLYEWCGGVYSQNRLRRMIQQL